jgi:effector-binding domain-containing protein
MKKTFSILMLLFLLFASAALAARAPGAAQALDIKAKEVSPFSYCCITHKGPFTEIENVIGRLMQATQSQNIFPTGAMIGVYYNSPDEVKPENLEWEMGFPISAQVNIPAPLKKKRWTYTAVVSAVHKGAYEETGKTIAKMSEWMQEKGLVQAGPLLERYLTMPTPQTKPEDLRSEIWIPYQKIQK